MLDKIVGIIEKHMFTALIAGALFWVLDYGFWKGVAIIIFSGFICELYLLYQEHVNKSGSA